MQIDSHDIHCGIVCALYSLASLFNNLTDACTDACVILNLSDESRCYVPDSGLEMEARRCFDIISYLHSGDFDKPLNL